MQIEILTNTEQLQTIADEWNALLKNSASHVPFLRMEYMLAWWEYRGGGEWEAEKTDLCVITARNADDKLIGGAPLFLNQTIDGTSLMLIGSHEISDYLDFVAAEDNLPDFIKAVFEFLASADAPKWTRLDLYNILNTSPTMVILENTAAEAGWTTTNEELQPAPYIPLGETFEDYLASIKKKQRGELRRKLRRAENHIVPVAMRTVTPQDDFDTEMDTFIQMMRYDHHKDEFLTPLMEKQVRLIAKTAMEHGWLQFIYMEVDGQPAGVHLNFEMNGSTMGYNSGVNPEFYSLSPGQVLAGEMFKIAIEKGHTEFDFMRGDEQYKYRLGGINRFVHRVQVERMLVDHFRIMF